MTLPRLTIIADKYAIGRALGEPGQVSCLYKAYDLKTEDPVILSEYFPRPLAKRGSRDELIINNGASEIFEAGRTGFLEEARALCAIGHINIVPAIDYVEDHGTVYVVFKRPKGASLSVGLEAQGGRLPERAALAVLTPVFEAVKALHDVELLHEGISPDAVFLAKSGQPMLFRFQSAQVQLAEKAGFLSRMLTPGYAPPEQYVVQSAQGPWTDVYGCAATLYRILSGKELPGARQRLKNDDINKRINALEHVSAPLIEAMKAALVLDPGKRTRTIAAFLKMLEEEDETSSGAVSGTGFRAGSDAGDSCFVADITPDDGRWASDNEYRGARTSASSKRNPTAQSGGRTQTGGGAPRASGEPAARAGASSPGQNAAGSADSGESADSARSVGSSGSPGSSGLSAKDPQPADSPSASSGEAAVPDNKSIAASAEKALKAEAAAENERRAEARQESAASPNQNSETNPGNDGSHKNGGSPKNDRGGEDQKKAADEATKGSNTQSDKTAHESDAEASKSGKVEKQVAYEPHVSPALKKEDKEVKGPALVGAVLAALFVVASAAFLFVGNDSANAISMQAAFYLAQADSLYDQKNYTAALAHYEDALAVEPTNKYILKQLEKTSPHVSASSKNLQYWRRISSGDDLLEQGDSLRSVGEVSLASELYTAANQKYLIILSNRPNDSLAMVRMRTATSRLYPDRQRNLDTSSNQSDSASLRERLMGYLQEEGDSLYAEGELELAREKYRSALDIGPNPEISDQIAAIDEQMTQAEREQSYEDYMESGRRFFQQGNYENALQAFEGALDASPGDVVAEEQLKQVNNALATVRKNESMYASYREEGDAQAANGELTRALASYKNALNYKPEDAYVTERIAIVEAELEEGGGADGDAADAVSGTGRVDEDGIYIATDQEPSLIGSLTELHEKVSYPSDAYERGIEGRVYVRLAVNERGDVFETEIVRGIGGGCDQEAIRVLKTAKFEPGVVDGEPVRAWTTLFIQFDK